MRHPIVLGSPCDLPSTSEVALLAYPSRLGMTLRQMVAVMAALLSGEADLPSGSDLEDRLLATLRDNAATHKNFSAVVYADPEGTVARVISGSGVKPKHNANKNASAAWEAFRLEEVAGLLSPGVYFDSPVKQVPRCSGVFGWGKVPGSGHGRTLSCNIGIRHGFRFPAVWRAAVF